MFACARTMFSRRTKIFVRSDENFWWRKIVSFIETFTSTASDWIASAYVFYKYHSVLDCWNFDKIAWTHFAYMIRNGKSTVPTKRRTERWKSSKPFWKICFLHVDSRRCLDLSWRTHLYVCYMVTFYDIVSYYRQMCASWIHIYGTQNSLIMIA